MRVKGLRTFSKWLVVLGAINWGLVALLNYNMVMVVFRQWPVVEKWIYLLMGSAGVWGAYAMLTKASKK